MHRGKVGVGHHWFGQALGGTDMDRVRRQFLGTAQAAASRITADTTPAQSTHHAAPVFRMAFFRPSVTVSV
jgi:hypothetical protein